MLWRKPKRTARQRPPHQRAKDLLIKVFSVFIRTREARRTGRCFICGKGPVQDCYHLIPCGNSAVRFEPDNACGACKPCNFGEFMNRGKAVNDAKIRAHHVRMVGEARVQELEAMKGRPWKKSAAELVEMAKELEARMGEGRWA